MEEILNFYKKSFENKNYSEKCQIILGSKEKITQLVLYLLGNPNQSEKEIFILKGEAVTRKPEIIERLIKKVIP